MQPAKQPRLMMAAADDRDDTATSAPTPHAPTVQPPPPLQQPPRSGFGIGASSSNPHPHMPMSVPPPPSPLPPNLSRFYAQQRDSAAGLWAAQWYSEALHGGYGGMALPYGGGWPQPHLGLGSVVREERLEDGYYY